MRGCSCNAMAQYEFEDVLSPTWVHYKSVSLFPSQLRNKELLCPFQAGSWGPGSHMHPSEELSFPPSQGLNLIYWPENTVGPKKEPIC